MSDTTALEPRTERRKPSGWKKAVFSIIPLLFLLIAAEVVARASQGSLLTRKNYRVERLAFMKGDSQMIYDSALGYRPAPGTQSKRNAWHTTVTIDADGLRSNGSPRPQGPVILCVGDSYTYGEEASDNETWPAHLEKIMGQPVLNGGSPGYGFDQTVLRAEQLVPQFHPQLLIASLVPDDIARCEMACRYAWKPYFEIENGQLALRNVPVPKTQPVSWRGLRNTLGYSALADAFCNRAFPAWWQIESVTIQAHNKGSDVAALLVGRLQELCRQNNCALLILIQGRPQNIERAVTSVTVQAKKLGIPCLNLHAIVRNELDKDHGLRHQWFNVRHMTSVGNEWVARQVTAEIAKQGFIHRTTQSGVNR